MRKLLSAVVVVVVLVLGWHLVGASGAKARVQETCKRHGLVADPDDVSVNPITNLVTVRLPEVPGGEDRDEGLAALGKVLGSVLGGAVAKMLEPPLERDLAVHARESYDLYAIVLPYRVQLVTRKGEPV